MSGPSKPFAVSIPPGTYPVIEGAAAAGLLRALRDPTLAERAAGTIAAHGEAIRKAVLGHVERLETAVAKADFDGAYGEAHEIRGLAGNAGLAACGRIANGLCIYLDALARAGAKPDGALVGLYVDAVARAARSEDEGTRLGSKVAGELAALAEKRLAGIKD